MIKRIILLLAVISSLYSCGFTQNESNLIIKLRKKIENTNKSLPMPIDQITILTGMMLIDKCITLRYVVDTTDEYIIEEMKKAEYIEAFKQTCVENLKKGNLSDLLNEFAKEKIYMRHIIFDKNGTLITLVEIKF